MICFCDRAKEAEDKATHKALYGESPTLEQDSTMPGDVILGDYASYQQPSPMSSFGRLAGTALVAAAIMIPIAWMVAEYVNNRPEPTPVITPDTDTDTTTELKIFRG